MKQFDKIADCEVRELEIKLEGDAKLNVYKSILIRFSEDGDNPIWLHDSSETEGVSFYYQNIYEKLQEWGYDYDEIVDYGLEVI